MLELIKNKDFRRLAILMAGIISTAGIQISYIVTIVVLLSCGDVSMVEGMIAALVVWKIVICWCFVEYKDEVRSIVRKLMEF